MGISIWQLLIGRVIVRLLFGTKKLRSLGTDLGGAVKGFRSAMGEGEQDKKDDEEGEEGERAKLAQEHSVFDGDVSKKEQDRA